MIGSYYQVSQDMYRTPAAAVVIFTPVNPRRSRI